jgi:hypothetical protein
MTWRQLRTVREFMRPVPPPLEARTGLAEVARVLHRHDDLAAIALADGLALVSARELLPWYSASGAGPATAGETFRPTPTIPADASLEQTWLQIKQTPDRRLIVVEGHQAVGWVDEAVLHRSDAVLAEQYAADRGQELRQAHQRHQELDQERRELLGLVRDLQRQTLAVPHRPAQAPWSAVHLPAPPLGNETWWITQDGTHTWMGLAAVTGRGLAAGAVLQFLAAVGPRLHGEPAERLDQLQVLLQNVAHVPMVSLWCGQLSPTRLAWAAAGPMFAWWLADPAGVWERLPALGPPLGLLSGARWDHHERPAQPGNKLVVVGPGVKLALPASGQVRHFLNQNVDQSPTSLVQRLVDHVAATRGTKPMLDDVTVLAVAVPNP